VGAVVLASIVVLVALLALGGYTAYSGTLSSPSAPSPSQCISPVPAGDRVLPVFNRSFIGFSERYNEGPQIEAFPIGSCPEPVPSALYTLISATEANANFTRAEGHTAYTFWTYLNSTVANPTDRSIQGWTYLYFNNYSNVNEYAAACGFYYTNISQLVAKVPVTQGQFDLAHMTESGPEGFSLSGCADK